MSYIFAGDSWALKGFTEENYAFGNNNPMPGDVRLADHWGLPYKFALAPGKGNLSILDKILELNPSSTTPIIWVYTEPGRDYGRITGKNEFDWLTSENIFEIRQELNTQTLETIRSQLDNPIGLIGGLSDISVALAKELEFTVLHPSWQQWIAQQLNSQHFQFGWGACDVGWRADYNNIKPSKAALFAWDDLIKDWCWWQDNGYFSHEHPSPRANLEFAKYLEPQIKEWLKQYE
jgi:hypothetical protein